MTTPEILTSVGATITGATLLWQVVQFSLNKNTESKNRQFEVYHRLIKELVEPPEKGATYVDRQTAVVFELRHFRRYRDLTIRILEGLQQDWEDDPNFRPRLKQEINLTLAYLNKGSTRN